MLSHIDLLLQYALLVAGEEDEHTDRQLGPIHLIKYVYLSDLAFAERNDGKTFTGVNWQFYKFGPWSQAVKFLRMTQLLEKQTNMNSSK